MLPTAGLGGADVRGRLERWIDWEESAGHGWPISSGTPSESPDGERSRPDGPRPSSTPRGRAMNVPDPPRGRSRPTALLRGRDILCFSHDWSGDPLSKTHLMRLLARDNRVLWVNSIGYRAPTASRADLRPGRSGSSGRGAAPIREVEPNLFVLNPLAIPAYGRPALRALNRRLLRSQVRRAMRRLGFRRPINWVFNPAAGLVAGRSARTSLIYYCVDEYTAFSGVAVAALAEIEADLLRRADAGVRLGRAAPPVQGAGQPADVPGPPRGRLRPLPQGPRPRDPRSPRRSPACPGRSSATSA